MSGRRVLALYALLVGCFAAVVCRLYWLCSHADYAARAAAQSVETAPISRAKSWASVSSACTKPSRGRALERIVILAPQTC